MADGKGFSAATRDRVLAIATELGWVPSGPARGLASRRTGIVGLLFPDLGQSGEAEEESLLYVDQVIRGAERAATAVGDAVLIAATRSASGRELAFSMAGKVDGLVVMARSLCDEDMAYANIQALRTLYPGLYGVDGFFDAVNPTTGAVGHRYLVLDESMIMASLDNALDNRAIQRDFARDPVAWAAHTYLELEKMPLGS